MHRPSTRDDEGLSAMADPTPDSDVGAHAGSPALGGGGRSVPPATPRWVKVTGIVVLVLIVLVVVILLLGHGPGQHNAAGAAAGRSAPAGVALVWSNPGADT